MYRALCKEATGVCSCERNAHYIGNNLLSLFKCTLCFAGGAQAFKALRIAWNSEKRDVFWRNLQQNPVKKDSLVTENRFVNVS